MASPEAIRRYVASLAGIAPPAQPLLGARRVAMSPVMSGPAAGGVPARKPKPKPKPRPGY